MALTHAFIPYGAAFATPFCRWQGSFAAEHPIELAGGAVRGFLARRKIDPRRFDGIVLGLTVPQKHSFYGAPWLAGLVGAPDIGGPMVSQACATGARALATAAVDVETGERSCVLAVTCDRTSNGPHIYYPTARGPGGRGESEDWVWDNFQHDPWAKAPMIDTAERLAKERGISRAEQDEVSLIRHLQYADALADDRAFQKRYMEPVQIPKGRREVITVAADEGPRTFTAEALAKQSPVREGGTLTGATQTYPADGAAGVVVCSAAMARELAPDAQVSVRLLGFGSARVEKGRMPAATVPAARQALERAGVTLDGCAAVKTHNPFAVNDVFFSREMGIKLEAMNRFGCPLVYGHPQAPTGMRLVVELIEELVLRGGGRGLFVGCAAGDTAMGVVVEVSPGPPG